MQMQTRRVTQILPSIQIPVL